VAQREVRQEIGVGSAAVFFDNDLKRGMQMQCVADVVDYRETISSREINSGYAVHSFCS
jgi:hypothetical protein